MYVIQPWRTIVMIGDHFIFILNSGMGRIEDLEKDLHLWEGRHRQIEYLITFKYCIHCMMKTAHGIFRFPQRGLCCFKASILFRSNL